MRRAAQPRRIFRRCCKRYKACLAGCRRRGAFHAEGFKVNADRYFDHAFPIPVIEVLKLWLQKLMQGSTTVDDALAAVEAEHVKQRGG